MKKLTKVLIVGGMLLVSACGLQRMSASSLEKISWKNNPMQKEMVLRAENELSRDGITSEQREAYGVLSERVYETIRPLSYLEYGPNKIKDFILNNKRKEYAGDSMEDAWRLYLGMPQLNNTFQISKVRPSKEKGDAPYYYKLPKDHEKKLFDMCMNPTTYPVTFWPKGIMNDFNPGGKSDKGIGVMGHFHHGIGKDDKGNYFSYYDNWDLTPKVLGIKIDTGKLMGKPFEIYNRVYYNPETREITD